MFTKACKSNKGFVLAAALVLFSVLFVLASSYVISVQYDSKFFRTQQMRMQALLLARSGIQYYISIGQPKENRNFYLDKNKKIELEILDIKEKKYLKSTGLILYANGKEAFRKSVIAPIGNLKKWTESIPDEK